MSLGRKFCITFGWSIFNHLNFVLYYPSMKYFRLERVCKNHFEIYKFSYFLNPKLYISSIQNTINFHFEFKHYRTVNISSTVLTFHYQIILNSQFIINYENRLHNKPIKYNIFHWHFYLSLIRIIHWNQKETFKLKLKKKRWNLKITISTLLRSLAR